VRPEEREWIVATSRGLHLGLAAFVAIDIVWWLDWKETKETRFVLKIVVLVVCWQVLPRLIPALKQMPRFRDESGWPLWRRWWAPSAGLALIALGILAVSSFIFGKDVTVGLLLNMVSAAVLILAAWVFATTPYMHESAFPPDATEDKPLNPE
jgi:hypothetical protein